MESFLFLQKKRAELDSAISAITEHFETLQKNFPAYPPISLGEPELEEQDGHFNDVSTKYLNNYLLWNNFVVYGNGTENDLFNHLVNVFSINRTIQNRDAIPVLNIA